jgi:hypothetical protein
MNIFPMIAILWKLYWSNRKCYGKNHGIMCLYVLVILLRQVKVDIETLYVKSIYINVRSVHIHTWCQILPILKGNDKNAIVDALILSNNDIWPLFMMHPLGTSKSMPSQITRKGS